MSSVPEPAPLDGPALVCPQCRAPVAAQDKTCRACGVDLEMAAAVLERAALAFTALGAAEEPAGLPAPRFGDYLVRSGTITAEVLAAALDQQRALARRGQPQTIGQVLLAQGAVTHTQLDDASRRQVQELQAALDAAQRELQQRLLEQSRALQAALQKVAELNALKANFVANISHELRTPLATVMGYAEMLLGGQLGALPGDQTEAIQYIFKSSQELRKLIEDLIHFAASLRGQMALTREPVTLDLLAGEVAAAAQPKADLAGVRLRVEAPAGPPPWRVDREKLRWALGQLVDNALKFTPAGGTVGVSVGVNDGAAQFSVTDTGVGIAPEHHEAIFTPFYQVDGSITRRYEGAGLGLALVKRIVEAHGGRVTVTSQLGQGSCFSLWLPAAGLE